MRHNSLQEQFMSGNQFFKLSSIKNMLIESLQFLITKKRIKLYADLKSYYGQKIRK